MWKIVRFHPLAAANTQTYDTLLTIFLYNHTSNPNSHASNPRPRRKISTTIVDLPLKFSEPTTLLGVSLVGGIRSSLTFIRSSLTFIDIVSPRSVASRFLHACQCKFRAVNPDVSPDRRSEKNAEDRSRSSLCLPISTPGWARICGQPRRPVRNAEFRGLLIAIFDLPRCPARFFLPIGEAARPDRPFCLYERVR